MSTSLVSEEVTFAASSGKKLSAVVVNSTDQVFRAEVQYDLPHGVQNEHLRSILVITPPPKSLGWCAAPRPVRLLSVLRLAVSTPWCLSPARGLAPPDLLGSCAGSVEAGRGPGSLCLPLASAEAAAVGSLRVVPVRSPAMGFFGAWGLPPGEHNTKAA